MFRTRAQLLTVTLITLVAPAAQAKSAGDALLEKVDASLTKAKDQVLVQDMIVREPSGSSRTIGLEVHVRGTKKRRIHFTSPGDVKRMKILILARDRMYIYLPAYRKIRRIASHVRAQSMFGSDYNYDDMSTVVYGPVFEATIKKKTKSHTWLELKRRPGNNALYPRIEMRVRSQDMLPDLFYYFNAKGKKVKTETRTEFSCQKGMCGAKTMKMVDHTRNDHSTTIVRKEWKVDSGFSERIFSLRRLARGR